MTEHFDCVVVGGGPAGATAATDLALQGRTVLLLDRAGRIKPCGGAVPPRLIRDFAIPDEQLKARIGSACIVSPTNRRVDMPIGDGYVGMVDRDHFDEWLRERAAGAGALRRRGTFERIERDAKGTAQVVYSVDGQHERVSAASVIGADGALSQVARQTLGKDAHVPFVFAYHEIVRAPAAGAAGYDGKRCDVHYRGHLSPDFYGWVFPHGDTVSVGTGSAHKGFSLKGAVAALRADAGLGASETIRREGAPIPMQPLKRWDNGRDVLVAGDAAGVVAPASGEGIYYAMECGRLAADSIDRLLATGDPAALKNARKQFMAAHGNVFRALAMMQRLWYVSDERRERFVSICRDVDVQAITWDAYMNKRMVRRRPLAHLRIFAKNLAHLARLVPA